MAHHDHAVEIKNPGSWSLSGGTRTLFLALSAIGVIVVAAGMATGQAQRVWGSVLMNYFYYLMLALGGAFFVAIQHITSSMWSAPLRRVAEGFTKFLPVVAVLGLAILILGGHSLYEWTHLEALQHDQLLASKAGYLNSKFAIVRSLIAFGLWILFARKLVTNSLAQDISGDAGFTKSNYAWSAVFIPVFAISFSFLCFDYLMSLEPHWFSTMFAVYCFAGLFYSTLCATTVVTILLKRRGLLPVVNENHLHDLGKLMFGFAVFWAYIGFSQFMLIWYANLPEETVYYLRRAEGGWLALGWILLIAKFVVPFFLLMPRGAKRNDKFLFRVAVFMLVAHWLDLYVMVMPNILKNGPSLNWIDIGLALGFFGLFSFIVTNFFSKVPVMAFRDPYIAESVHHNQ